MIASTKIPQKVDGLIQEATSKEQKGNYNEAIIFYKKALTSLQKNQSAETGKIYFLLGNNFFYLGQSDSSINYYYKALAIGEKLNNAEILARSHQGIGSIYHEQKKYAEALLERTKAVQWARLVANNPSVLSSTLVAQALSNFWLKNYTKAMEIYQEVIPIALKINDYKSLRTVHMNIAAIHLELNIRKPILGYINKSLYYSALMKNPYYDCETNMLVGIFYWRLGEPEKAIAQLKQSVKMGKKINARSHLKRVYDSLAVIYTSKNDYKEALHYFKQSASLKDSIQSEKTLKHIKELEVKYHSVQKDKELAQKQLIIAQKDLQLKQKSKWILIPVIGIVLLTIISVFIFFYYKNKMKFHQQTLMLLEKDREISLLEAMMQGEETERGRIARDLHDGIGGLLSAAKMQFSVLKNTNGTTNHKAEFENGLHLLDESASEIRKTAHNLLPELLNRFGLEEGVFNYCQRVSTNKLRIDFVCMSEIPRLKQSFELTIYRIIQELVNNCIKHSDAREALVQLSCYQNFLVITVEDNGKGFTYQLGQMDGIGLDQIHSKINSVNGNIKIDSTEKGTTVYIEFDIEKLLITKEDIS
ncbi:tetratricopeptide repeat-containing sensor histidine kinase [Solitalea canadensis]|uniref:tetratricopeptide repeat-containing sensor histidine kinase n=1 Tax=Solitalea canadensis TaxID=995 RepID=UPI0002DF3B97|nr:tetratricopeptide repeat protein [Solitalea canadensis]